MNKDVLDYLKVGVCENTALILKEHHFRVLRRKHACCLCWPAPSAGCQLLIGSGVQSKEVPCCGSNTAQRGCGLAADGALALCKLGHLPPLPWDERRYHMAPERQLAPHSGFLGGQK